MLVEGLRRAGRDLTRERFLDAIESINNFSVGIASPVTYGPDRHQGLERVYFTRFDHGRFQMVTDWGRIKDVLDAAAKAVPPPTELDGASDAVTPQAGR